MYIPISSETVCLAGKVSPIPHCYKPDVDTAVEGFLLDNFDSGFKLTTLITH
jgi:hypothetical protein